MTELLTSAPGETLRERQARLALAEVCDPALPTLSVLDLGMIRSVSEADGALTVELMPTFLGCPALDMIRDAIVERLLTVGPVTVEIVRNQPWSSERITEEGRQKLLRAGLAPPPHGNLMELTVLPSADCPYCGSPNTLLDSPFGPPSCRAIHYCRSCRQPFEQFKAV